MPQDFLDERTRGLRVPEEELKSHINAYMKIGVAEQTFLQVVKDVFSSAKNEEHAKSVATDYLEFKNRYDSGRYDDASDMLWTISNFINSLYVNFHIGQPVRSAEGAGLDWTPSPSAYDGTTQPSGVDGHREKAQREKANKDRGDHLPAWTPSPSSDEGTTEKGTEKGATESGGVDSHYEKAEREKANKDRGDKLLAIALDELERSTEKEAEKQINEFTLAKRKGKKVMMVVLFRKMSKGEIEGMRSKKGISRKDFTDSYKWFTESPKHTDSFSNKGSSEEAAPCMIYLDGDKYLPMRKKVQPEAFSSGATSNRFHQEGLGKETALINFGVHEAEEQVFNEAIIEIKPLKKQ
jgi:hypothetical protein